MKPYVLRPTLGADIQFNGKIVSSVVDVNDAYTLYLTAGDSYVLTIFNESTKNTSLEIFKNAAALKEHMLSSVDKNLKVLLSKIRLVPLIFIR